MMEKSKTTKKGTYGLGAERGMRRFDAPALPYQPRGPRRYNPPIGLIGCGGITQSHLNAYRNAGFDVVALCDADVSRAEARRKEFYPRAAVYTDYRDVLARNDVEVVDIATHADVRPAIVESALKSRKHVLSQKPFVTDLNAGHRLVDLADRQNVRLAVNQNGRWAPHFSYIRTAVAKGLIGQVLAAHLSVHWNHDWTAGTPFDQVSNLVLFDFAIHWFDIIGTFLPGRQPRRVFATTARAAGQKAVPPLLAQALIEYDDAQASLVFDGFTQFGPKDETYVAGTRGSLHSTGPNLGKQTVTLFSPRGYGSPKLAGSWFPDGFRGTMAELLRAIEEDREPSNSARDNLNSVALCFAACRSAATGKAEIPGRVSRI
jgi:predicted dehydrogenase